MGNASNTATLIGAVQRYFDLMHGSDVAAFDEIFHRTAQLHGFRDGKIAMIPALAFKEAIASRPSLQSLQVPREEQILLMDFASPTQALVKVRVRWNTALYVDYLTYHCVDGKWLITSKGFHIEKTYPATVA